MNKKNIIITIIVITIFIAAVIGAIVVTKKSQPKNESLQTEVLVASEGSGQEIAASGNDAETQKMEVEDQTNEVEPSETDVFAQKIADKETFFLYVKGADALPFPYDDIDAQLTVLNDEYTVPVEILTLDENKFVEKDLQVLSDIVGSAFNVNDIINKYADEDSKVTNDNGTTFAGFYAFKDGELVYQYNDLVLPEGKKISLKVTNFIFESDLFVDNHGLDLISYEDVLTKIENGEKFILYVGRDTCPYCHIFSPSLETVLQDTKLNTPIYYLYTQSYKTAINNEVEDAQRIWDTLKSNLGISYTPSLVLYNQGYNEVMFDGYVSDENFWDLDKDTQQTEIDETTTKLREWFASENLIAK